MEAYDIRKNLDEFSAAREQFEKLVGLLQSGQMARAEHSLVEKTVWTEGFELMRRLFQGHLDLRSEMESPRESVRGSDGGRRTHRRAGCVRTRMISWS